MKRITISFDIDLLEDFELPVWLQIGKTDAEIEDFCNDKVLDFIREKLELDFDGFDYDSVNFTTVKNL
jgi:hypothetical protein